jgi:protein arginine N-methyltransferase 1
MILSILQVYAVEASTIADLSQSIIEENKMEEKVKVIKGKIEDIALPVEKVDVIISEWMGFYLLHESMLDSVIYARDKFLAADGHMVPSDAVLYMTPVNMSSYVSENILFWDNVFGYDFSPVKYAVLGNKMMEPTITCIEMSQCVAEPEIFCEFDLKTVSIGDIQNISQTLIFTLTKPGLVHGFASWFDVEFKGPIAKTASQSTKIVTLSTSPSARETHWKQTVIFIPVSLTLEEGDQITSSIDLCQDETNKRHYNISIEILGEGEDEDDSDSEEDDSNHPIPCDCGATRCILVQALVEKYDAEQTELEKEAEKVDVSAEVEAAKVIDREMAANSDINLNETF